MNIGPKTTLHLWIWFLEIQELDGYHDHNYYPSPQALRLWGSRNCHTSQAVVYVGTATSGESVTVSIKITNAGTYPVVQWLGLRAFIAEGTGSIPGRGTKIPQATRRAAKKKQEKLQMAPLCQVSSVCPCKPSLHLPHPLLCPGILSCMGTAAHSLVLWLLIGFSQWGAPSKRRQWGMFIPQPPSLHSHLGSAYILAPHTGFSPSKFQCWYLPSAPQAQDDKNPCCC